MKLFISFLIALVIVLLGTLIVKVLGKLVKRLVKRYGYDVVDGGVVVCCIIAIFTLLIYSLW